jgi:hypothetical protein
LLKKKKKNSLAQPQPSGCSTAAPLKNRSYHQIWVDIELRKLNLKQKLNIMIDKNIVYKKNKKKKKNYHYTLLFYFRP